MFGCKKVPKKELSEISMIWLNLELRGMLKDQLVNNYNED